MRGLDPMAREIGALAEAAAGARSREQLRVEVTQRLIRGLKLDCGIIWSLPEKPDEAVSFGFSRSIWERYYTHRARYAPDLQPIVEAVSRGEVVNERRFDRRTLERLDFYAEIIKPVGAHTVLTAMAGVRGRGLAIMQLGRQGRTPSFGEREERWLQRMLPVISLGEALHDQDRPPPPLDASVEALSPREREIVEYLALGFTNREIALALGTSPHTVHTQMKTIFRKMDVSTRAELVALSVGHHPNGV